MPSLKKYKKGIKRALKTGKKKFKRIAKRVKSEAGTFRLGFKKPVMATRLGF